MHLQESGEMYLETIYVLSKNGVVRSLDVAEYMGFSKPSVSRAVGLLKQGGYLLMDKDGYLTLTESGWRRKYTSATLCSRNFSSVSALMKRPPRRMRARWSTTSATNRFRR